MSWIKKLGLAAIGILAIAATFLKGRVERLKREAAEQELEDTKASNNQHDKAVEAMVKGVENENTKEHDNRKYDFTD